MDAPDVAEAFSRRRPTADDVAPDLLASMVRLGGTLQPADAPARSQAEVLAASAEAVVVRVGAVVVKAHHEGTDGALLAARLAVADDPALAGILLPPLLPEPRRQVGRWLTAWPFGRTVTPDPDAAPWTAAATLLARLHATPAPRGLPPSGGPARVTRTVRALADLPRDRAADAVHAAWLALPAWVREPAPPPHRARLTHGDWHFGQLVAGADGDWRLCDVDDLGLGDPLWDLGRPAAYLAVGVVLPQEFAGFLDAYRAAGGELPGPDPWPALDVPARAYTVQTAARALLAARRSGTPVDDLTLELVAACRRMSDSAPS